jgi:hypothetical protein
MTKRVPCSMMENERMENPVTEAAMDPLQHIELPTLDAPLDFYGWLVGTLDNGGGDRLRWAVLELYRWQPRDGGPMGYILYTIGHSVVYHVLDSECGRGVATTVGALYDIAPDRVTPEDYAVLEPCPDCEPEELDDLDAGDQVEMEKVWYKWQQCADADELLLALRKEARCKNCFHRPHVLHHCPTCRCEVYEEAPRPISSPGVRLLAQVKGQLPDVAEAMSGKKIRL